MLHCKKMWWLIILLICFSSIRSFSILDLDNLHVTLQPQKCQGNPSLITLIHSAPKNYQLRDTIRRTWGRNIKRIFVLGDSSDWNEMLKNEHKEYKDILQVSFIDAYRNMTYKHLSGYW